MATHEHDPTDVDASLVISAQSTKRQHTTPNCQGTESSTCEPTRDTKVEQYDTLPTVGSSNLGLPLIPVALNSISNYLNVQMSKCQQFSWLIIYPIIEQIYVLLSPSLHPHHCGPRHGDLSPR